MVNSLDTTTDRLFWSSFVLLALFIPFSIAGANIAIGFGALAWIVAAVTRRSARRAPNASVRTDPLLIASILLVVSAVPSMLVSEDFGRAFKDWKEYWMLLIYFMVATHIVAVRGRSAAFWTLAVSATISSIVGLVQFSGGIHLGFIQIAGEERASSTMFTMTFAGIMYQLVALNFAAVFARAWSRRQRVFLWVALTLQFCALLLTMTRGAWVAVVAGLFAVGLLVRNRTVLIIGVVAVAGLIVLTTLFPTYQGRNMSPAGILSSTADYALGSRFVLWDVAWEMFKSSPITGVGFGDFTIEADKLVAGRETTTTVDAHNAVLHVLATRGIIGFVPFVFFWFALFRGLFGLKRRLERGSFEYQLVVGAIGATVAVLAGSLTELNIDDAEVFIAFMFILGLARSQVFAPNDAHAPSPPA